MNVKNPDGYYDSLEKIREEFGDKQLIPLVRVADWLGADYRTLKKTRGFPIKEIGSAKRKTHMVPATGLAAWMSS